MALPLLALAALAVWRAYDGERMRAGDRLMAQARAMAFSVDREFDRAEAVLRVLASAPVLAAGDHVAFEAQMRALSLSQFDGEHLTLALPDGTQLINTAWPPGTRRPGAPGYAAAKDALMSGRAVVSNLHAGVGTNRPTVAVVVPVFLPAGMLAGANGPVMDGAADGPGASLARPGGGAAPAFALSAALPLRRLARILSEPVLPAGWGGALLDATGVIVARTARPEETVGQRAMPAVVAAVTAPDPPAALLLETPTLDGIASVVALGRASRSGYWTALAAPESDFSDPLRRALLQLLATGAALLAAGLLLSLALARRVRASLRVLVQLGTGNLPLVQQAGLREVDDVAAALATAERRRRVLVAELNHRVKNMLATVQSVALQTLRARAGDASGTAAALTGRLRALAAAHDLITAGSWEAVPLAAVLQGALRPWLNDPQRGGAIRIESATGGARLGPLQAQSLMLALNELATNAVAYGALSVPGGQVILRCAEAPEGRLTILWSEAGGPTLASAVGDGPAGGAMGTSGAGADGRVTVAGPAGDPASLAAGGAVAAPPRQGFGTRLLRRALAQDLGPGAEVELRFDPGGLTARIGFRPAR
ncbi:sensor histidine kinase [Paracraurococcus ruber]|uniref:sensor histidine kinase n=1 Tax=Paracraurococcus ruber TaxID=77675 RepID=UPI00105806B4|nr:sensor histidine kinase [Paracraurococcus ruber]TDG27393.1 sensor histidine kinase [Paracraurococcus ruber]